MFGGRFFSTDSRHSNEYQIVLLVLYSYETDFIQGLLNKNEKKLSRSFNFTFRYINYVFSLNNSNWWLYWSHLSHWACNNTHHSCSFTSKLIVRPVKNATLQQKRWFQFVSWHDLWTLHLYVATFQQHLHMEYVSLSWYGIPEFLVPITISLIECCF
jgi:hypothetical protein